MRALLVMGCFLVGCTSTVTESSHVRTSRNCEVSVYNEYEHVVRMQRRIAKKRAPFYAEMSARVHAMDVRAGKLRECHDTASLWSDYDRKRAELGIDVELLPFNAEHAYAEKESQVLSQVIDLETALDQIEERVTKPNRAIAGR